MPKLIRLFVIHAAIGYALGAVLTGLIIYYDMGGLGTRILTSNQGWQYAVLFTFLNGNLFAAVQISIAVFLKAEDAEDPPARPGSSYLSRRYARVPQVTRKGRG